MLRVILLGIGLLASSNGFATYVNSIADRIEVVGILGNEHAGAKFDGIIVVKLDSGRLAFLRLNDSLPGFAGISVQKVENKRVYIGARGGEAVPLMWLTTADTGSSYSSRSMDMIDSASDSEGAEYGESNGASPTSKRSAGEQYDDNAPPPYDDTFDGTPPPPPPPPPPLNNDGDFGYDDTDYISE